MYHGDLRLGDTLDFKFSTAQASGAPTTLAGSPVISAYVDNGTTEITAGITLTVDFDGRTGLHHVRVVASSGNGFAAATNVEFVLTAGTVNSVSVVGMVVGSCSIECRSALMPTTAARKLDVSAGGEAGVDWANVGSPTTTVDLSGTNIKTNQVVASVSGAVGSVTGLTAADVVAIKAKTDNLPASPAAVADIAAALDATIADSIPADGTRPSVRQALYMLTQFMLERSVSSTTVTIKKPDGASTLFTLTLDSATSPTSITRAT